VLPIRDEVKSERKPVVTVLLIVVNVAMFFYELMLGERLEGFLMSAAFVPARVFVPGAVDVQIDNALLSMFLHGGWAHIGGNLLFLWIFGDNVEDRLGHFRYLLFYLLCGYAATYAHAFVSPQSALPAIGASGAIAGVLGAYVFLHPRGRIVTLLILGFYVDWIRVPAIVYLPVWFLLQVVSGFASISNTAEEAGGVAWFAHIGGFVAGPLLLLLLGGRRRPQVRAQRAVRRDRAPWA
jgi:membrane associated rhomboid family serine protease